MGTCVHGSVSDELLERSPEMVRRGAAIILPLPVSHQSRTSFESDRFQYSQVCLEQVEDAILMLEAWRADPVGAADGEWEVPDTGAIGNAQKFLKLLQSNMVNQPLLSEVNSSQLLGVTIGAKGTIEIELEGMPNKVRSTFIVGKDSIESLQYDGKTLSRIIIPIR